jgi:hypothetical protein
MSGHGRGAVKDVGRDHLRVASQVPARRGARRVRRSAILVLGMHRSGTSAVARVLSLLGAELPRNLLSPAADNLKGFWESSDLMTLHEDLLAAAGSSWDDWTRLPPEFFETREASRFRARLLALLEADFAESRLFVVKDPRMCRLVPFWRGALREFGASTRVVIPVRNPLEVAASLSSRNGFSTTRSLLVWLRHVLDAERETRDLPRCIIRFDDLLRDNRRVLAAMRRGLAITWPRSVSAARTEIAEFLSAGERHHSADGSSLAVNAEVPVEVRRAFQALGTIAVESERARAQAELDQIGAELDRAAGIFGPIVGEQAAALGDLQRACGERAAEVEVLRHELATTRDALGERSREAARVTGELTAALAELPAVRGELTESQALLGQRLAEIQNLTGQIAALRSLIDARAGEIGDLRETVARSAVDVADRETVLAHLRDQLSEAHGQLDYMVHSFSWRLMAPMRAVRRRLGPQAR